MAKTTKIHFILRGSNEPKTIYLKVRKGKNASTMFSLPLSINSADWNTTDERARDKASVLNKIEINNYLNDLDTALKKHFSERVINKKERIDFADIKQFLFDYIHPKTEEEKQQENTFNSFIEEY